MPGTTRSPSNTARPNRLATVKAGRRHIPNPVPVRLPAIRAASGQLPAGTAQRVTTRARAPVDLRAPTRPAALSEEPAVAFD